MQEMQDTQVRPLGQEDPLEEGIATHSSILAWEIPWAEEPGGLSAWGHKESDTTEQACMLFFQSDIWSTYKYERGERTEMQDKSQKFGVSCELG